MTTAPLPRSQVFLSQYAR